jgi:hypothetical protein
MTPKTNETRLDGNLTVMVRCSVCQKMRTANRDLNYRDVGKVPQNAFLGIISNCPRCSDMYGYLWLKWYDENNNEISKPYKYTKP